MFIVEAPEWVVMAWRCADEEQARRRASGLHSQSERDEFMRRYRALSHERELSGDSRVADALIRRGETRLARRQPIIPGQAFVLMQALGDSAVVAPISDCVMVLGSLLGPWYPRGCRDRMVAYRTAMSDDVSGIVIDEDGTLLPIYQGWKTREQYGVHSDDDEDIVERVDPDGTIVLYHELDEDDDEDDYEDDDEDVQYGGALRI